MGDKMIYLISCLVGLLCVVSFRPRYKQVWNHDFKNLLKAVNETSNRKKITNQGGILDRIADFGSKILKILKYEVKYNRSKKLSENLLYAGLKNRFDPYKYMGLKVGMFVLGILYGFILFRFLKLNLYKILAITLPFIGYFWPNLWLKNLKVIRIADIQKGLPFTLSSIAVIVESGQSLTEAIREITRTKDDILSEEFRDTILEMDMGFSRKQAFERMINRNQCTDLSIFLSSMIQSFEKGASGISQILLEQSEELWKKRTEKAKSLAEKASIKLFMPLLLLVLPAMLIFVMTPAILSLIAVI